LVQRSELANVGVVTYRRRNSINQERDGEIRHLVAYSAVPHPPSAKDGKKQNQYLSFLNLCRLNYPGRKYGIKVLGIV
jgi:hypothetical protein